MTQKRPTVLAVVNIESCSGRNILTGLFRYVNEGHPWNLRLVQDPQRFTPDEVAALKGNGIDGVIARLFPNAEACLDLARSPVRSVIVTEPLSVSAQTAVNTRFFRLDNEQLGREAARYLLSRSAFRSYGFYTSNETLYWSKSRQSGFCRELSARRRNGACFAESRGTLPSSQLTQWLLGLPKPAAILADNDDDASWLLEACRACGLSVPAQVAILGVDNDEFLCNLTKPTLSSVEPNHVGLGYAAAQLLDRMIAGRSLRPNGEELEHSVLRIVERDSSRTIPPAGHLIGEALDYIRRHACEGITPKDVAAHLGVSRRLMDLRFNQVQGETVLDLILKARLDEVKRRLTKTSESLGSIATACGFSSHARLANVFRKTCGMTMAEWRLTARSR